MYRAFLIFRSRISAPSLTFQLSLCFDACSSESFMHLSHHHEHRDGERLCHQQAAAIAQSTRQISATMHGSSSPVGLFTEAEPQFDLYLRDRFPSSHHPPTEFPISLLSIYITPAQMQGSDHRAFPVVTLIDSDSERSHSPPSAIRPSMALVREAVQKVHRSASSLLVKFTRQPCCTQRCKMHFAPCLIFSSSLILLCSSVITLPRCSATASDSNASDASPPPSFRPSNERQLPRSHLPPTTCILPHQF
jgi:hypothetical protein